MPNNPNAAANLKPFTKNDVRINRSGRPKDFDALRRLAQEIAHEKAQDKSGNVLTKDGHALTYAETILRRWAASSDFKQQQAFIEVAFGKVPNVITGPDGHDLFPVANVVALFQSIGAATDGDADKTD